MALVFNVTTEVIAATDPTTVSHPATGTVRAVVVLIAHGTVSTDIVVGVTYGGVAMTRIQTNVDTATEAGRSYAYFLGKGIPQGTQTVSVDKTEGTTSIHVVAATWTGDAAMETVVVDFDGIDQNVANPSVTLQYQGLECVAVAIQYTGAASPGVAGANCTLLHTHDFTAFGSTAIRQTTAGSVDFAISVTLATDDSAYSAFAFTEASPAELISFANHVPMGQAPDGETMYLAQYDDTAEQSGFLTATVLDTTWVFSQVIILDTTTEEIVAAHDIVQLSDYESLHMPRAPPWDEVDQTPLDITAFILTVPEATPLAGSMTLWVLDVDKHWPAEFWPWEHSQDQAEHLTTAAPEVDATTEEINAAHDVVFSDYTSQFLEPIDRTAYDSYLDDAFQFADRLIDVSDDLNVTVDDTSQVDKFETIEGLVAANYSSFQGSVEPLETPSWDDYQPTTTLDVSWFLAGQAPTASVEELVAADPNYGQSPDLTEFWSPEGLTVENKGNVETAFVFADRLVDVLDTLNVTVTDTAQVDKFETIEGLVAAGYSTFYGTVEAEVTPTWDEYLSTTSLDVTWFLAGQAPPATVEELTAANYSTFQGDIEGLDDPALTIEDYSNQVVTDTSFLSGIPVSIDVSDAINITVDDQATVQQFESIVGLVAANYSVFYGTVEAFQPPVLTIEDYSVAAVQDVAYIFATINVSVTESINVVVDDISTLTRFETIEGLVAAGYSTFFGTVEALFLPRTTIEDHSSGSHDVSAFVVLSGPPTPPQPWGPFEVIVDDYTYTAVVDILETTSSDDVYQPIEPEEGG